MFDNTINIQARLADMSFGGDQIDLYGFCKANRAVVLPARLKECSRSGRIEPFLSIRITEAQQLMDSLWQCGLRPSQGSGSAGSLKATENHLGDMRTIAFKLMETRDNNAQRKALVP